MDGARCEAGACVATTLAEVLTADGRFETLLSVLETAGLTSVFAGDIQLTVFAPTDAAFQALEEAEPGTLAALEGDLSLLTNILLYHVLPGRQLSGAVVGAESFLTLQGNSVQVNVNGDEVRINESTIVEVDLEASNGVAHAIAAVLSPPEPAPAPEQNIIEALRAAGNFGTLLTALDAVEFTEQLSDAELPPLTLFAPTDAVFQALEEAQPGTLDALLADRDGLTELLRHHVVGGRFFSGAIALSSTLFSGLPAPLDVVVARDGQISVGGAVVTGVDLFATNGVIHTVSSVIAVPADSPVGGCAIPTQIQGYGAWFGDTNDGFATQIGTCGEEAEAKEQIFQWNAPADGQVCMVTAGSRYDTVLHVRTGVCSTRRSEVACNDDIMGPDGVEALWSRVELEVQAGEDYFVIVDGFREGAGRYLLRILEGPCEAE